MDDVKTTEPVEADPEQAPEQAPEPEEGQFWTLQICRDADADNPLNDNDWFTFAGWHRRYTIGTVQPRTGPSEYRAELVEEHGDKLVILPVYMLDHSGVEYSCKPFNDSWDSGQVGYVWTTHQRMLDSSIPAAVVADQAVTETYLQTFVQLYSAWASGDVWGYVVTEHTTCQHCGVAREVRVDEACWGFSGSDKRAREYLRTQVPDQVAELFDEAWSNRE